VMHKRRWCVSAVATVEELAQKLTQHTWTLCTGFFVQTHPRYLFPQRRHARGRCGRVWCRVRRHGRAARADRVHYLLVVFHRAGPGPHPQDNRRRIRREQFCPRTRPRRPARPTRTTWPLPPLRLTGCNPDDPPALCNLQRALLAWDSIGVVHDDIHR